MVLPSNSPKALVVLSGGMDSTTLLHWTVKELGAHAVQAVTFQYGAKHNEREMECASANCERLDVLWRVRNLSPCFTSASSLLAGNADVPDGHYTDQSMRSTVVPLRNGVMLMVAASMAEGLGAKYVTLGAHAGDHAIYPDCRPNFLFYMQRAIEEGTYAGVRLLRPFVDKTKADIARLGADLGVDFASTYSCYRGGTRHCGKCGTCVERAEALHQAGVADPTAYEHPEFWKTAARGKA